jgi:hypothetical protein
LSRDVTKNPEELAKWVEEGTRKAKRRLRRDKAVFVLVVIFGFSLPILASLLENYFTGGRPVSSVQIQIPEWLSTFLVSLLSILGAGVVVSIWNLFTGRKDYKELADKIDKLSADFAIALSLNNAELANEIAKALKQQEERKT